MLRALWRLGLARGLRGGSRAWRIVGITAGVLRFLAWVARKEPKVVYQEELEPGHTICISHLSEG